jgi:N-acetylglucosamine kinase-like BadF-type ATPase
MSDAAHVAIDLGGTGARVSISVDSGRQSFEGAGWDPQSGAFGRLADLVKAAAEATLGTDRTLSVAAGLTGLNGVIPPLAELGEMLNKQFNVERLVVADDSLTSALGATGGEPAVVLAVGTGAVALGIGPHGEIARVDGAGGFLGDRGSGWWIGRQGLIAALSQLEGREGGSADLLRSAINRYGPLAALPQSLREAAAPFSVIAAFATDVATSARRGDLVSMRIFQRAADHLATAVAAAAFRTNQSEQVPVILLGGLGRASDIILPKLFEKLRSQGLTAVSRKPLGDALSGAEALFAEHNHRLSGDLIARWEP